MCIRDSGLWSYYRREWFSPAVGLATFLLAELRIGSLAGLLLSLIHI